MTPAGIEPATFRFVTQHLNHCATAECVVLIAFFTATLVAEGASVLSYTCVDRLVAFVSIHLMHHHDLHRQLLISKTITFLSVCLILSSLTQ